MGEFEKIGDIVTGDVLDTIWGIYRRQKDEEADAGVDVSRDIARMEQWIQDVKDGNDGKEELDHRFPDVPEEEGKGKCPKCGDTGLYFSRSIEKSVPSRRGGKEIIHVEGMATCLCVVGRKKLIAIRELGKKKEKKRRSGI